MNEQDLRTEAFKVRRCGDGYSLAINLPGIMDGLIGRFSKEEATFANEAFRKAALALLADRDRWRGVADGLAKVAHKHVARELDYGRGYFHDDEALAAYDSAVAGQPATPDVNAKLLAACKAAERFIAHAPGVPPGCKIILCELLDAIWHAEGKP